MQTDQIAEKLISCGEVAELFNKDRSTITRWAQSGKLAVVHRGSGRRGELFFDRKAVEELAARPISHGRAS